jgi:uncharacterized protein involved in type VI secretion and phage assembly
VNLTLNPISLITGILDSGSTASAKRAPFELRAGPFVNCELEVISFRGQERVNDVYEYGVTFTTEVPPDLLNSVLLGAPGCLTVKSPGNPPQIIQGLVASLEGLGGVSGEQGSDYHRYRLAIVPKLWLLKRHRVNRVFQGKTVMQIVQTLLDEVGMTPAEIRWRTVDSEYPILPFVYQRNESDFDFFRRVLASAGIFFYFEHPNALPISMLGGAVGGSVGVSAGGFGASVSAGVDLGVSIGDTVLNFARRASDTPALAAASASVAIAAGEFGLSLSLPSVSVSLGAGLSGVAVASSSGTLLFDDGIGAGSGNELVYKFGLKKRVRAQTLQLLEREVATSTNWIGQAAPPPAAGPLPAASVSVSVGLGGVSVSASVGVPFDLDTTEVDATVLREERYQVDPTLPLNTNHPLLLEDPKLALELARTRRNYLEARGKTDCRRLGAGYRFTLANHPIPALNGEYTVTVLNAEGHNPDFVKKADFVYRGQFRCIPSTLMPLPPRPKKRPKLGLEMAQVVAYTDILTVPWLESSSCGYVKIRFRWDVLDAQGTPAGPLSAGTDDSYAIWVPVMQPWAGAGYGAQFIPREGMEVLVGFLEQQGERPVILGCLYSAVNSPPWTEKTDQQRAQMDLAENVLNDQTTTIGNDRTTTVGNDESLSVTQDRSLNVGGNDSVTVSGDASRVVSGADTVNITGDSTTSITGDVSLSTQGKTTENLQDDVSLTLGAALDTQVAGQTQHSFADDYTERHLGHRTIIIGSGDAHRTAALHVEGMGRAYASKTFEVEVLSSFTLICGNSQILVSPDGITLNSTTISLVANEVDVDVKTFSATASGALTLAGKTATLETSGAQVALDSSSANVTASQVKLGSGSGSVSQTNPQPVKVTQVQMKDSQGKPRANARVLLTAGGEQRMTVLDANGMLELLGDTQYQISFPDDPVAK